MSYEDCIDIVQEWADARFLQPPIYIDRGDPAAHDFAIGDFIFDSTWRVFDLSGIVPDGATAVNLIVTKRNTDVGHELKLRRHGNANIFATSEIVIQVANILQKQDFTTACSADRKLDYFLTGATCNTLFITVKGWWL